MKTLQNTVMSSLLHVWQSKGVPCLSHYKLWDLEQWFPSHPLWKPKLLHEYFVQKKKKLTPRRHKALSQFYGEFEGFAWFPCQKAHHVLNMRYWIFPASEHLFLFSPQMKFKDPFHSRRSTGGTNNITNGSVPVISAMLCSHWWN